MVEKGEEWVPFACSLFVGIIIIFSASEQGKYPLLFCLYVFMSIGYMCYLCSDDRLKSKRQYRGYLPDYMVLSDRFHDDE